MKKYLIYILFPLNTFAQIQITNGLTQTIQASTNGEIVGRIKMKNIGKKQETFSTFKFDIIYECGRYGNFTDTTTHDKSLNNWLDFDVDEKQLSPNQEFDLIFRINMPDDASPGTYWSAVMIEYGDLSKPVSAVAINDRVRYAVQIIVNKGNYEAPKLIYKKINIFTNGIKSKMVTVELENIGFFSAKVKTQLELYDEKGTKIQTIQGDGKNIYPSRCNIYNIEVKNLKPGKYDGIILADTGKKIFGSNITLKID
jgi:hypothetical protein